MNGFNPKFTSINQITDQYLNKPKVNQVTKNDGVSFQEVLEKTRANVTGSEEVKFSKHASLRLNSRNISLSDTQIQRLQEGTNKAKAKGINDSLVIVDDLAFIVNVPNRTVVTAINQNEAEENIFTNIDGAVII